jgi:hypothetical protein
MMIMKSFVAAAVTTTLLATGAYTTSWLNGIKVPRFDGTAARSRTCILHARAPGKVMDCWVGKVDGHRFTFITWNHNGFPLGYTLKMYSGHIYEGTKGPYFVYEFSGHYVCWLQQAGAAAGAVNLLTDREIPGWDPVWSHVCVTPMLAIKLGYILGLRGRRWRL